MDVSQHWKTIVDTLQDGLLVVDPQGIILAANQAAERVTGYGTDELIGKSCRLLNCTGCKLLGTTVPDKFCQLFVTENVKEKKCLITNKERRSVYVLKNAKVLKDDSGNVIRAVETLTDITDTVRQQQEIKTLKQTFQLTEGYHGILGKSLQVQRLFDMIDNVAPSDTPVMILGPSGSGKELVARAIHRESSRRDKPFVKVNCASLNENLLESELFGHVKGAFAGADKTRVGRFEAAHGGTLLLDEIGDIPPALQVKLLRVLEDKKIERVGDNRPIPVDVRIISATNRNLEKLIAADNFREDLFFRINVFPLHCPALADRREDIPLIARNFIRRNATASGKKILGLTPEALEKMTLYSWPGNVRELRNTIEYAFVLCPSGAIGVDHLPPKIVHADDSIGPECRLDPGCLDERTHLIQVLREAGGNQSAAARQLGVSRVTVWKRVKKYGIDPKKDL